MCVWVGKCRRKSAQFPVCVQTTFSPLSITQCTTNTQWMRNSVLQIHIDSWPSWVIHDATEFITSPSPETAVWGFFSVQFINELLIQFCTQVQLVSRLTKLWTQQKNFQSFQKLNPHFCRFVIDIQFYHPVRVQAVLYEPQNFCVEFNEKYSLEICGPVRQKLNLILVVCYTLCSHYVFTLFCWNRTERLFI